MSRARLVIASVVATAGAAAADPLVVAFPDLAPPPARPSLAATADVVRISNGDRVDGTSASLRLRPAWESRRARVWLDVGAVAWRDHGRLIADHALRGTSMTNPALGGEVWTAPGTARGYLRLAVMAPRVAAATDQPAGPVLAPDDTSTDRPGPSQQARIDELAFERPTTAYYAAAAGLRVDLPRVVAQAEVGLDLILPTDVNHQHGPLYWLGLGLAAPVTPRVAAYGRAVARLARAGDLGDRDAGVEVGAGAVVAVGPGRLTAGLATRADAGAINATATEGWGPSVASTTVVRLVVGYAVPLR